jgi:hypothetical protein
VQSELPRSDKEQAPEAQRSAGVAAWSRPFGFFLLLALVFGLSYTQAPLYYSNQHQYFLHGLARGGSGFLDQDWLANTADPTSLFSAAVAFTYRYLHESLFYVYYVLLLGLYAWALVGLFGFLTGSKPTSLAGICFLTLFITLHTGLVRLASARLFGKDYPWYFQAGVANQYLLGPGLQPSVFGVFLVAALVAFLRDRPWLAAICSALAAVWHSTYLLGAAFLTVAFMVVLVREKRRRDAFLLGLLSFVLVLPVVVYSAWTFAPSSAEAFAETQRTLVAFRIPGHAVPTLWCDAIALAQVAWIVLGIVLSKGTRLAPILALVFALSVLLTLVQVWTGNDTLALLFPWRISVVLVPVATTVVLARGVQVISPWLGRRSPQQALGLRLACGLVLGALVLGGLAIQTFEWGFHTTKDELDVLKYVRDHKRREDTYLIPVEVPKLGSGKKGAYSGSFLPPPTRGKARNDIAVDLQRFRLFTGAPLFVDFKSIPYKDVEVKEWRQRLDLCQRWYGTKTGDFLENGTPEELADHGITHVVTTAKQTVHGTARSALELVYEDDFYRVYRLR